MDEQYLVAIFAFAIIQAVVIYPVCRIYKRAGFKWYWGLITLVPLAGFLAMLGALGLTKWPSTSTHASEDTGAHSLYWLAGFSALVIFGVPGIDSEEARPYVNLVMAIYFIGTVAEIYRNAGYSGWGGIMGLLGFTNLIWPWLIAFRAWPTVVHNESIQKSEDESYRLREIEVARKWGIHPEQTKAGDSESRTIKRTVSPPPTPSVTESKPGQESLPDGRKIDRKQENEKLVDGNEDGYSDYEQIAAELIGKKPRVEGVYLKAQLEAHGDEKETSLLYTKFRLEQLSTKE